MSRQLTKQERQNILDEIKNRIERANEILKHIKHPDDGPRKVEEALGLLDEINNDTYDGLNGEDLLEHYFS